MRKIYFLPLLILFFSCTTHYYPAFVSPVKYRINDSLSIDSVALKIIKPYTDSLKGTMNTVLAYADTTLYKKQPESTLGNFLADALLIKGIQYYNKPIDISIVNYGGIRIPSLPQGNIMLEEVFELLPFDNEMVVVTADAGTVNNICDVIADAGGWPVAGMSFSIKGKKPVDIKINNLPLDTNKKYTILVSDYLANGGDNMSMLKDQPKENLHVVMRNALIEYLQQQTLSGKPIHSSLEGRIKNEQ